MTMTPEAQILLRVPANHLDRPASALERFISLPAILTGARGRVARGGHLLVTTTEVIFEPHSMNLNSERSRLRIPIADILAARPRVVILHVTVVISTARGGDLEFVTWSRKKVLAAIQQARAAQGLPLLMQ
ncbi:hypothetical protein [Actinomyces oris]|uniref:GRAM domain-containing protein n=1 Tax=Actinomyces oris TaxID=544580 RepID=A0AAW8LCC2_9ACTO|nr:hypothetical protein [Actinomyces oris]MDR0176393.1 hypothetical protein [Actinomyces oris]